MQEWTLSLLRRSGQGRLWLRVDVSRLGAVDDALPRNSHARQVVAVLAPVAQHIHRQLLAVVRQDRELGDVEVPISLQRMQQFLKHPHRRTVGIARQQPAGTFEGSHVLLPED